MSLLRRGRNSTMKILQQVENVFLQKGSEAILGTLSLMKHFMLFKAPEREIELWVGVLERGLLRGSVAVRRGRGMRL